jgi:hypothetical protein
MWSSGIALQLGRVPHDEHPVEHGDPIGELVGLVGYWVVRKIVTPSRTRPWMICHMVCRLRDQDPSSARRGR